MYVHFGFFITLIFLGVNTGTDSSIIPNSFFETFKEELMSHLKNMRKSTDDNGILISALRLQLSLVHITLNHTIHESLNRIIENDKAIATLLKLLKFGNCDNSMKTGRKMNSGVEKIYPYDNSTTLTATDSTAVNYVLAYCKYVVQGEYQGAWTVIQRRDDNVTERENFKRPWKDYVSGFGNREGEYWIGLKAINAITNRQEMQLQIILEDWKNKIEIVNYQNFRIDDESNNFQLHISGFKGNINDSMAYHNDSYFSTFDRDNDQTMGNCAKRGNGGWWYTGCSEVNLNALAHNAGKIESGGMHWYGFDPTEWKHPLRRVVMMIKPLN